MLCIPQRAACIWKNEGKKIGLQTSFGPRLEVRDNKPTKKIQEIQFFNPNSKKDKWGKQQVVEPTGRRLESLPSMVANSIVGKIS